MNLALEKLAESGLDQSDFKKFGFRHLQPKWTADLEDHYRECESLYIPYYDTAGDKIDYHRVRYLEVLSGVGKARKYDGPKGQPPRAYFPPILDWKQLADSPINQLLITEGELKAACAAKMGLNCLGLGGVWSWKSKKLGMSFLPELEAFEWAGRTVELCFDSDIVEKPEVQQALLAFSRELTERKAKCQMVLLPTGGTGEKVGLDDYLVKHGVKAYAALPRHEIHRDAEEVRRKISQFVYIAEDDQILHLFSKEPTEETPHQDFLVYRGRQHFMNAVSNETVPDGNGGRVALGPFWFKHPDRISVPRRVFRPDDSRMLLPGVGFNLFRGFGVEPRRGKVLPMLKILRALIGDRKDLLKWFIQWMAYPLQHPGEKLGSAVFMFSPRQGIGKSAVGIVLKDIYGIHGRRVNEMNFFGQWSDWLEGTCFALVDELSFDGTTKSRSKLKTFISEPDVSGQLKFRDSRQLDNHCNFYFTGNSPGSLPLENENRRLLILEAQGSVGEEYLQTEFDRWRKEGGASHWLYYLLNVDLEGFHPKGRAPTTPEEELAKLASSSTLEIWARAAVEGREFQHSDLWRASQLLPRYRAETQDYRSNIQGLTRALTAALARKVPQIWIGEPVHDLFILRNHDKWLKATNKQIRDYYYEKFPQVRGELETEKC